MPELPEVQTIINFLNENIIGEKIINISVLNDKFLKNSNEENFKKTITNKTIENIERIGKYLIFHLSDTWTLVVHLRMEGKFFIDSQIKNRKHDYIIFELSNNSFLSYNDSRQFGTFHITKNIDQLKEIQKVEIDPLNEKFDTNFLLNKVHKLKKSIKLILLDQSVVSGIGNIYANEILFDSKISPLKRGCDLNKNEIDKIVNSSIKILKLALKYNGTTIHTFSFGNNKTGEFNKMLKVVNRENKKCFDCDSKIERIKQGQRSTYYCPNCQK